MQRAGEAEAVQQPEGERDQPRPALPQAWLAPARAHDLGGDEDDAERDEDLDRRPGYADEAERRLRERDAAHDDVRGDRADPPLSARHQQHQREHEEQVVHATQDVLDAKTQVGAGHLSQPEGDATISSQGCPGCTGQDPHRRPDVVATPSEV